MTHIEGIGGLFFRSKDPEALKKWYVETLGMKIEGMVWNQAAGPTVFEPFPDNTEHFSREKQWMLNLRVNDLRALIKELKAKGIAVEERDEWNVAADSIGTFARIHDPEGNPLELWEPTRK